MEFDPRYEQVLREELLVATGCTEPIAVAYCAAQLKKVLGALPDRIEAEISPNILKNVKSVIVPNSGNQKGIGAAIAAGIIAGDADAGLQVIADISEAKTEEIRKYTEHTPMKIECSQTGRQLDIKITGWAGTESAAVQIANNHENIVLIEKNGKILFEKEESTSPEDSLTDKSFMTLQGLFDYAVSTDLTAVQPILDRQIRYNNAIAEEGIRGTWGAAIGYTLLKDHEDNIEIEARAYAAAGSDARMSGCEMPVVIVSGSGNQGITASVPVIRYAKHLQSSPETLYRALLISNLVTIYQKVGIGRLSAYCGAISAGVGAGAGIAFLLGCDYTVIAHTTVNAVAILSGTICDGAKPSCAAKIAEAVDAGILGYKMFLNGKQFRGEDGIVKKGADLTVRNIGILASQGMADTDKTIIELMLGEKGSHRC